MFTISFNYDGNTYSALVHEKYSLNAKQYRITIMNGELEQLLFGNHILIEKDGNICPCKPPNSENAKLISEVIKSLNEYLVYSAIF